MDYNGKMYGGGSPCDSEKEIMDSIKHAKETIKQEGDTPVVIWKGVKPLDTGDNLTRWF